MSKEKQDKIDKLAKFGLQMADMVAVEAQLEGFQPMDLLAVLAVMADKMVFPLAKINRKEAWGGYFGFLAAVNRSGRTSGLPVREIGVLEMADFFRMR